MNEELPNSKKTSASLDARFANRPEVRERLHQIADLMDRAIAEGATADEAEAKAIEQIQQLGSAVLTDWARAKQAESLQQAQQQNPTAIRHIKKK
jgi:hypothetical protein